MHQQPTATRCITFTSSPCLLQVCCRWPVHTHIPSCCRCTGSSSAMRISGGASATNGHDDSTTFTSYPCLLPEAGLIGNEDFRPCMLHVADQLIGKWRVQNECSAFCSHHIHTHTLLPVAGRFIGNEHVRQCISNQRPRGATSTSSPCLLQVVPMRISRRKYVKYC